MILEESACLAAVTVILIAIEKCVLRRRHRSAVMSAADPFFICERCYGAHKILYPGSKKCHTCHMDYQSELAARYAAQWKIERTKKLADSTLPEYDRDDLIHRTRGLLDRVHEIGEPDA